MSNNTPKVKSLFKLLQLIADCFPSSTIDGENIIWNHSGKELLEFFNYYRAFKSKKSISDNDKILNTKRSLENLIINLKKNGVFGKNTRLNNILAQFYFKKNIEERNQLSPELKALPISPPSQIFDFFKEYCKIDHKANSINNQYEEQPNSASIPQEYCGLYNGFYFRPFNKHEKQDKPIKRELSVLVAFIKPDGEVEIKTTHSEYKGEMSHFQSIKAFYCNFSHKDYRFMFSLVYNERSFDDKPFLKGTHSGISPRTKNPLAGRIILKRIAPFKNNIEKLQYLYNQITPENKIDSNEVIEVIRSDGEFKYDKNIQSEINELNQITAGPNTGNKLIEFFLEDDYVEDLKFIKAYNPKRQVGHDKLAGTYYVCTLFSDKEHIQIGICYIDKLGNVIIKGEAHIYFGAAYIFHNFISIAITRRRDSDGRNSSAYYISYLLAYPTHNAEYRHIHGVRILPTSGTSPTSARVVFAKGNFDYTTEQSKKIRIYPVSGIKSRNRQYDSNFKNEMGEFTDFEERKEIFKYLQHEEDNLVISPAEVNAGFQTKTDYHELFYLAALQLAQEMRWDSALNYLDLAWRHGYNNIERISQDMKKGKPLFYLASNIKFGENKYFYIEHFNTPNI